MTTTIRALLAIPLLVVLAGCAPVVALGPADDAKNTGCADVIVGLRNLDTVAGLPARETDAQGTAAWGTPATVILRCGVPVPDPTSTLICYTVNGVDWLADDSDDPNFVFTTYGRDPAVEVIIDSDGDPDVDDDGVSGTAALGDLANAVSAIPATGKCLSAEDVVN